MADLCRCGHYEREHETHGFDPSGAPGGESLVVVVCTGNTWAWPDEDDATDGIEVRCQCLGFDPAPRAEPKGAPSGQRSDPGLSYDAAPDVGPTSGTTSIDGGATHPHLPAFCAGRSAPEEVVGSVDDGAPTSRAEPEA